MNFWLTVFGELESFVSIEPHKAAVHSFPYRTRAPDDAQFFEGLDWLGKRYGL